VTDPAAPARRMTVEEFLEWAETQEEPYELVDGVPVPLWPRDPAQPRMMAPPSRRHQDIVLNTVIAIRLRLRAPCWATLEIAVLLEEGRSRIPDVVAACVDHDEAANLVDEPALVVEVLSPQNEGTDRTVKLDEYKALPSVREIWLVASTRRWAQIWRREADTWIGVDLIPRGTIESPWLASQVPLDELYAGVDL
jgi:Uma2 family endonuclease